MSVLDGMQWDVVANHLLHLAIAYVLALPIAWDREAHSRGVGLRTFPLVAIGCCAFLLIGREVLEGSESHARLLYGLMSGIGFIGGGAILKQDSEVSGTATAAAIWATGAIGAAVAWQHYEIALVLGLMTFVTFRFVTPLKAVAQERGGRNSAEHGARDGEDRDGH